MYVTAYLPSRNKNLTFKNPTLDLFQNEKFYNNFKDTTSHVFLSVQLDSENGNTAAATVATLLHLPPQNSARKRRESQNQLEFNGEQIRLQKVRDTPDDDQEVDLFSKNLRAAEAAEIKRKNSLLKLQKKMEEKRRKKEERAVRRWENFAVEITTTRMIRSLLYTAMDYSQEHNCRTSWGRIGRGMVKSSILESVTGAALDYNWKLKNRATKAARIIKKNWFSSYTKLRTRSFLQKEQVGRNVTYYVNQRLGSKDQDVFRGFFVEYDIEGAEIKKASAIKKVSERNGGGVEEDEHTSQRARRDSHN